MQPDPAKRYQTVARAARRADAVPRGPARHVRPARCRELRQPAVRGARTERRRARCRQIPPPPSAPARARSARTTPAGAPPRSMHRRQFVDPLDRRRGATRAARGLRGSHAARRWKHAAREARPAAARIAHEAVRERGADMPDDSRTTVQSLFGDRPSSHGLRPVEDLRSPARSRRATRRAVEVPTSRARGPPEPVVAEPVEAAARRAVASAPILLRSPAGRDGLAVDELANQVRLSPDPSLPTSKGCSHGGDPS